MIVTTASHHTWGLGAGKQARLDEVSSAGQNHWLSLSPISRLVSVDNSGHNIQVDQTAVVIKQIRQLLR